MSLLDSIDFSSLKEQLARLRGDRQQAPDVSIIIPVNAQGDLLAALTPVNDILKYRGSYRVEIVLVINNYPPDQPPIEIEECRRLGMEVAAVPSARRLGEVVILSARAIGVRAAHADMTIHFDADCRIPHITKLINWYIEKLRSGAELAYSLVDFYDYENNLSVRMGIVIHHTVRWVKRTILGIPTTRGSNYAVKRDTFLKLYDAGKLSVDLQVGPATKLTRAKIAYSSRSELRVLTSGRKLQSGWKSLFYYLRYRLQYNLKATPTRKHEVTRTSWDGFNQESKRREVLTVPTEDDRTGRET